MRGSRELERTSSDAALPCSCAGIFKETSRRDDPTVPHINARVGLVLLGMESFFYYL